MKSNIRFFSEDIAFSVPHPIRMRRWLRVVATQEGKLVNELSYIFCSDEHLHRLNLQYLNHDTLTDIITFDTREDGEALTGEMYISTERVADNAQQFGVLFEEEMARVMVHGLLHLCGYQDKSEDALHQMRQLESFYLKSL